MSFYMSTLFLPLEILIPYFPQKYSILNVEVLPPWSFLIPSVLSQISIKFYKASFLVKGHEVPIIPVMYIAFVFQFSIIFTFLLSLSPQKCLYRGSLILHTRIHLILTSIWYAVWEPFLLYLSQHI